jgi:predicted secreted protein
VLRERALTHLRGIAAEIADPVRSELLLAEAADAFGVSRHALLASASRRGSTPAPSPASDSTDQQETAPENERRLLAFALGSRRARRHLLERGRPGPWRSSAHTAIAEKLASVPPEVDAVTAVHQLGVEGTDLEPVLAGLLSVGDAAPDGADLDPVAEIDAILDAEERLSHRARSRQERDDIDAAYRSGSDEWKDRLARDRHGDDASSHPTDPS